jgi:AcrR family transcriptional regulator
MSPLISASHREQYVRERREQILDAATEVFEREGFAGATVEEIASAVGISKGTVYLYFKSKKQIFVAILTERSFVPILSGLVTEDQPLHIILRDIAESFLGYMETHLSIVKIGLADASRFPEGARLVYQESVLKGNLILADLLEKRSKSGNIRPLENPFLTARAFMGMLMFHVLTQEVLGGKEITPIKREDWINESVHVFLDGLVTDPKN